MDGSELVFILMPIVIPLFLALGIAAPYIADSRANKRRRVHKKGKTVPADLDSDRDVDGAGLLFRARAEVVASAASWKSTMARP